MIKNSKDFETCAFMLLIGLLSILILITVCIYFRNRSKYQEVSYLEVLLCRKMTESKKKEHKNKESYEIMKDYNDIVAAIFNDNEYSDTSSLHESSF